MAERTVKVVLDASITGLQSKMKAAAGSVKDFSSNTSKYVKDHEESISKVSTGLLKFSAVGVAAVGMAVKKFADFDEAMSNVQAATHESAANMELLRAAAIDAGANTQYSATDAAGAIEELAKAGMSASDILNGGLSGALNLAASDQMDVAEAASITSAALVQFGLAGNQASHVADLLAAGAGKALGGVSDLGQALNNVGGIAASAGFSIEETTGFLSAMASYGYTGAEAGTQFKSMLQSLQGPSSTAQKALDELGLSLYDNAGNTKSLTQFVGEYKASLEGKTEAEKAAYNTTIFGSYGIRAATVAYDEGAKGIQSWIDATNDMGYAAETAALKTDNLKGDVERLGGSLETVFITAGSGANDALRGIVQSAESMVDTFGRLPEPVQQGALGLLAFTAAAAGVVGIGGKVLISSMEMASSLRDLGVISDKTNSRIGKIGSVVGKVGGTAALLGGLVLAINKIGGAGDKAALGVEKTLASLLKAKDGNYDSLFSDIGADFTDMAGAMDLLVGGSFNSKMERFGSGLNSIFFGGQLGDQVKNAREQFESMGEALAQMVQSGNGEQAAEIFAQISAVAREQGYSIDDLNGLMPAYSDALAGVSNSQDMQADSTAEATSAIEDQTEQLQELIDAQLKASGNILATRDAQRQFQQALLDANEELADNGQNLDITTEKGRENQKALDGIASSALDVVDAMIAEQGTHANIQPVLDDAKQKYINMATAMGMGSEEAQTLADKLFAIPTEIKPEVNLQDNATSPLKQIAQRIASTPDHTSFIGINNGASGPLLTIGQQIANLPAEKRIRVILDQVGLVSPSIPSSIRRPGAATGGAITGPGTGTSDSILMRLSNGEHVLTARDVQAMGGQSGVYRFRQALQAGQVPGYASGGAIPREARVTPSYMSQPSVSVSAPSLEGLALTGSLNINGVLVPLVDARIERQQKRFARGPR